MAEFEAALLAAVEKLTALVENSESNAQNLEEASSVTDQQLERIQVNRSTLNSHVETILSQIVSGREQEKASFHELERTLTEFRERIEGLQSEVQDQLGKAKESLISLDSEVDVVAGEVESALQTAQASLSALTRNLSEVDSELDSNMSQITSSLGELSEIGKTCKTELSDRVENLRTYFSGECLPSINQKSDDFRERSNRVAGELKDRLQHLGKESENLVGQSLKKSISEHNSELEKLVATAKDLEGFLSKLKGSIETLENGVIESQELLGDGVKTTNVGLETALGCLREVQELLERF